jgi:hypothetical protein
VASLGLGMPHHAILRCIIRGISPPAPFELSNGKFEVFILSYSLRNEHSRYYAEKFNVYTLHIVLEDLA